jgi:hypothetical protein
VQTAAAVGAAQQVGELAFDLRPGGAVVGLPGGVALAGAGGGEQPFAGDGDLAGQQRPWTNTERGHDRGQGQQRLRLRNSGQRVCNATDGDDAVKVGNDRSYVAAVLSAVSQGGP